MSVFELRHVTLKPIGIHHPPIEDGRLLPEVLLKKTTGSEERNLYRYDAILHFAIYFLKTNELSKAKEILDEYLDYPDRNRRLPYIHTDLFAKYLLGLYKMKMGDKDGEQEALAIIHIFSDVLEYTNYANSLQIALNFHSQRMLD